MKSLKNLMSYLKSIILIIMSAIFLIIGYERFAFVLIIIYIIYNLYLLWFNFKKEKNINEFIEKINDSIRDNVCNLTLPIVLISKDGIIKWCNNQFSDLKKGEKLQENNIVAVTRGLNISKITKSNNKERHQRLKLDGKLYDVFSHEIENESEKYYLLYFNDISNLIGLDNTRESVMLLEIDNLNEALERTEENNRPLVVAEVERTINTYAHKLNAMIKKYDTNKYVLSVQDIYIDSEINEKFKILEEVSNINKGNKIQLTISIGIGKGGISPLENSNFATVAKELALGRGGDQVVVKTSDDIKIFGGNTNEVQKRTRVRARVIAHALKELIYESSKVYIIGHSNPDMDCLGAALGLSTVIRHLGKECNIILKNDTYAIDYFLGMLKEEGGYEDRFISIDEANKDMDEDTLLIVVDVHNKGYVSDIQIIEKAKRKVIIDHHRRSPDIIEDTLLNYIEVYASSTSEMITELIQYMEEKPKLTSIEAEGLLAGIYMDTKGFAFKTGVRTFEAASFLRDKGADTIKIKKMFTETFAEYILIADTIKSAEIDEETNIAIAVSPMEVHDTVIVAKSADELLNISGISASFVLAKINGDIYISGRSSSDINVQVILEELGGGGHMNMAGARIPGFPIETVIMKLKESIKKHLRVGE